MSGSGGLREGRPGCCLGRGSWVGGRGDGRNCGFGGWVGGEEKGTGACLEGKMMLERSMGRLKFGLGYTLCAIIFGVGSCTLTHTEQDRQ